MRKKYQLYFGTVYISFGNVEPKFTYKLTLIVWNWLKHSNTMDRKVCEMFWKAFELEFIRIKVRTYCPAAFSLFHFCSHSSTLRIFFDLYFVHRLLIICLFIELYSIREKKNCSWFFNFDVYISKFSPVCFQNVFQVPTPFKGL